jgi:hypothetical protein
MRAEEYAESIEGLERVSDSSRDGKDVVLIYESRRNLRW